MSKILSIVPYKFLPPVNGGHHGALIVEKILSLHNKVDTIGTTDNHYNQSTPFTTWFIIPNNSFRYFPYYNFRKIYNLAKQLKPDYIFCHHHYLYLTAKKLANKLNIPLYIRCHNIESERFRSVGKWWWKAMNIYERIAFRNSDKLFFVTEDDKGWAIANFNILKENAIVMPFGMDFPVTPKTKPNSKKEVAEQYQLNESYPWLFFMGLLTYSPNEDAVKFLIREIVPLLKKKINNFHLLICGKGLSEGLQNEIKNSPDLKDVIYLGFVPEIEPIITSCDIMVNPVVSGGGVKTKVIESLAWNKTLVSAHSGAIGIEASVCGDKLLVAPDYDWEQFATLVEQGLKNKENDIPSIFFDYYYSENIAARMQQYFK